MQIQLSDTDLAKMPPNLSADLLRWLQYERLKLGQFVDKPKALSDSEQLTLTLANSKQRRARTHPASSSVLPAQSPRSTETIHTHTRLSQLFAAGFTKTGMVVRVR